MKKSSLKQVYSTHIRVPFWTHWLLICVCLISITGCFTYRATPDTRTLRFYEDDTLPSLTLARRVVPEVGSEERRFYGDSDYVQVVSESKFGDPDGEPDLSCIYAGLREALPSIDIIPATTFWDRIEAPQNVIKLPELFAAPKLDRLLAFQADVLVIAYHARIDLEYEMSEFGILGRYRDKDRETAAIVVVDLSRKTIIHGSRITYEDHDFFLHDVFIFPRFGITQAPSNLCNTVARQAGDVIALTMPGRSVRALVIVAAEDPVAAADEQYEAEIRKDNNGLGPSQPGQF